MITLTREEAQQPEALRLADEISKYYWDDEDWLHVADELRRLHEVNAELVEVNVSMVMCLEMVDNPLLDELRTKARSAIRKATGE